MAVVRRELERKKADNRDKYLFLVSHRAAQGPKLKPGSLSIMGNHSLWNSPKPTGRAPVTEGAGHFLSLKSKMEIQCFVSRSVPPRCCDFYMALAGGREPPQWQATKPNWLDESTPLWRCQPPHLHPWAISLMASRQPCRRRGSRTKTGRDSKDSAEERVGRGTDNLSLHCKSDLAGGLKVVKWSQWKWKRKSSP